MAYIGKNPDYGTFEKQTLTADGSTTTFSLNYTVGSSSSILVSVSGVVQEPETGYNISSGGTEIVFSEAPASGEGVFLIFLPDKLSLQMRQIMDLTSISKGEWLEGMEIREEKI